MKRSAFIDATKAVASQIIVLHHLVNYSPMAEWLTLAWPRLMGLLAEHGRLAVQPFLVIGGYLVAQSLLRPARGPWWHALAQRYWRLLPPLAVALALVTLATALVGHHLPDADWLSPVATPGVLLAHLLLVQDLLGVDSISAGAWYVAIDLQLFVLAHVLARLALRAEAPSSTAVLAALVAALTALSLLWCSRESALDFWGLYFFGAYGLGLLAGLAEREAAVSPWLVAVLALALLDALGEDRERARLALVTALALLAWAQRPALSVWPALTRAVQALSDISYSVFVCHFAVIVLFSGLWAQQTAPGLGAAVAWTLLAWLGALGTGAAVHAMLARSLKEKKPGGQPGFTSWPALWAKPR